MANKTQHKFCAVHGCDADYKDLHNHHIEPVVYNANGRAGYKIKNAKIHRLFDSNKPLGQCDFGEVFSYMFTLGCISKEETITLCSYHHNIMHGIIKFNKASFSKMVKEGLKKARQSGKKLGRPTKLNQKMIEDVIFDRNNGMSIRNIAKKYGIGCGTISKVMNEHAS